MCDVDEALAELRRRADRCVEPVPTSDGLTPRPYCAVPDEVLDFALLLVVGRPPGSWSCLIGPFVASGPEDDAWAAPEFNPPWHAEVIALKAFDSVVYASVRVSTRYPDMRLFREDQRYLPWSSDEHSVINWIGTRAERLGHVDQCLECPALVRRLDAVGVPPRFKVMKAQALPRFTFRTPSFRTTP